MSFAYGVLVASLFLSVYIFICIGNFIFQKIKKWLTLL